MSGAYSTILRKMERMVTDRGLTIGFDRESELQRPQLVAGIYDGTWGHVIVGPGGSINVMQGLRIEVLDRQERRYDMERAIKIMADPRKLHGIGGVVEHAFEQAMGSLPKRLSVHTITKEITGWYAQNGDKIGASEITFEINPDGTFETTPSSAKGTNYVTGFATLLDLVCAQPPKPVEPQQPPQTI